MITYNFKFEYNDKKYNLTAVLNDDMSIRECKSNNATDIELSLAYGYWSIHFVLDDIDFEAFFCANFNEFYSDRLSHIVPWEGDDLGTPGVDIHKDEVALDVTVS